MKGGADCVAWLGWAGILLARDLVGACNVHVKRLKRGAHTADDFAGPQCFAEQRDPPVLRFTDGAKSVARIGGLIGIEPAFGEFAFDGGIGRLGRRADAHAEGFGFEAGEDFEQLLLGGLGNYEAALGGIAKGNFVGAAKVAGSVKVAKKIEDVKFFARENRESGGPNLRGFVASNGFAAFGFEQFQADGFYIRAEAQNFHVEGKRGQIESAAAESIAGRAHSTSPAWGNLLWNSGDCFRTSSQSKKASGFSSQMRNQLAISSFSARLGASTFWLRQIISAPRFARRATFSTRSTAACSPCERNLRINSSRRMTLTSASSRVLKWRRSSNSSSYWSSASS